MLKAFLFYLVIIILYLCPIFPMTIKGITGIIFIIMSSTRSSLKWSMITGILLCTLQTINLLIGNNVDFRLGMTNAIAGSLVYLFAAFYLGRSSEILRKSNAALQLEIESRKSIEKELKENLSLLESLMKTLPTPVCFKDLNYRFTGCNAAYEEYFELKAEDIVGKSAHELFDAEVADPCLEMDIDLLVNKTRQAREVSFKTKAGEERYFLFTKALLSNDKGNPTGIVSVFLDTTDQKEREKLRVSIEEEKLIINEMQKYDKLKTEFFSNISHELRTPINVIFCAVQLMEMNLNDSRGPINEALIKKNVLSIKQNSLRLLRLVNNLIDITKIDAHELKLNLRKLDIVMAVREIVLSVSDYVDNKGMKLIFHSNMKEKIMAFDEEKLERIILNLLSNAIKFSPAGESIHVDLSDKGSSICIRIRDKGIGIPADRQQNIFQRFYQISPVNTRLREGSGIGLNLVKSLVELHQGIITLESEYGKGATFIIELPSNLIIEETPKKEEEENRQVRIEKIQLEFSDIYQIRPREICGE